MPPTSETPQVSGGFEIISLLPRTGRLSAVAVAGAVYLTVSRRGRRNKIVLVRECPFCQNPHSFRDSGLRRASCGRGWLVINGRRTRQPRAGA